MNQHNDNDRQAAPEAPALTLDNAPFGTLAPADGGGRWYRTAQGWKWNGPDGSGGTFPRPGGDWNGKLIPPASQPAATASASWDGFKMLTKSEILLEQKRLIDSGVYDPIRFASHIESMTLNRCGYCRATVPSREAAPQTIAKAIKAIPTVVWWNESDKHPVFNNLNGADLVLRKDVLAAIAQQSAPRITALLREARATLEMWKDIAPAVSLCADIDAALGQQSAEQAAHAGATESDFAALLPGTHYMDPPDGGDVTVLEQVARMAKDAARYRRLREGFEDAIDAAMIILERNPVPR